MEEEAARWRALPLDDLILERHGVFTAKSNAFIAYLDYLPNRIYYTTAAEEYAQRPELIAIPGYQLAFDNEQLATNRWEVFKGILTERLSELTFGEQLEHFRAESVANGGFDEGIGRLRTYHQVINARLRYLFFNMVLNDRLRENNIQALMANYNIPEMLHDVRVWVAWRDANPHINLITTPGREQIEVIQRWLLRALEAIRQDQRQRQFTMASGLHSRSTSLLRRLDPSLLQEIAQHARIEPPAHQPWTIWNRQ